MTKPSITLLILLIVSLVIIAGGIIYYNARVNESGKEITEQQERLGNLGTQTLEQKQTIDDLNAQVTAESQAEENQDAFSENLQLFENNKLNISFLHPKSWGNAVVRENTDDSLDPEKAGAISIAFQPAGAEEACCVAFSVSENYMPDHGGTWATLASLVENQEYIDKFCEEKENCAVYTNPNGVKIAKLSQTNTETEGGIADVNVDQYFIYHPDAEFFGLTFCTVCLEKVLGKEMAKIEISRLIDSLRFTK